MKTRFATTALGLVAVLFASPVAAQDCLDRVGRAPHGVSNDIAAAGDLALLANGAVLQVVDIADPSSPAVVAELSFLHPIEALAISGDLGFVATVNALHIVDLSEPTMPTETGTLGGVRAYRGLDVEGSTVYGLSYKKLVAVDVSTPSNPTQVGELEWTDVAPNGLAVVSDHAFLTAGDDGLRVVDVSDPTNPVEITDLDLGTGNFAGHLAVLNGRAFVSGYGPFPDRRLFVIDVTDPSQPVVEAAPLIDSGGGPIAVRDDLAYIMNFTGSLQAVNIYDVSEPRTPTWTGSAPIESKYGEALAAVNDHVLVTTYLRGLTIVETTDPTDPVAVATLDVPGRSQDAAYDDGVLFIATEERGLRMVDVSNPSQPVHLAYSDVVPSPAAITIRGDLAYAIGYWGQGLVVLDISNPLDLSVLGNAPGISGGWLTVAGDHAYLASWSFGIYVVDVSTPTNPVHVASLDLPSGTGEDWEWPVVSGDHLFVRNNHNDPYIAIIDVGDPTMPALVGTIDVSANVAGLATTGTWLLVPDYDSGPEVRIFDVSNPAAPIEHDPYLPVSGYAEIVEISGSVAYLSILAGEYPDYKQAVEAVDLADPLAPVFLGVSPDTWYVLRLQTGREGVFAVSLETGFDILGHCHSPIFADDFESGTTAAWSGGVP